MADIVDIAKRVLAGNAETGDAELMAEYIVRVQREYKEDMIRKLDKMSQVIQKMGEEESNGGA